MVRGAHPRVDWLNVYSRQLRLFLCMRSSCVGGSVVKLEGGAVIVGVAASLVVKRSSVWNPWVWLSVASNKRKTDNIDTQLCLTIIQRCTQKLKLGWNYDDGVEMSMIVYYVNSHIQQRSN